VVSEGSTSVVVVVSEGSTSEMVVVVVVSEGSTGASEERTIIKMITTKTTNPTINQVLFFIILKKDI
jgi:hypothetical protein